MTAFTTKCTKHAKRDQDFQYTFTSFFVTFVSFVVRHCFRSPKQPDRAG